MAREEGKRKENKPQKGGSILKERASSEKHFFLLKLIRFDLKKGIFLFFLLIKQVT